MTLRLRRRHPRRPERVPYCANPPELFDLLYPDQPLLSDIEVLLFTTVGACASVALIVVILSTVGA